MPISADQKPLYPKNWREISHRIRFVRAGGKCEQCQAPHLWYRAGEELIEPEQLAAYMRQLKRAGINRKISRIVLTTAHLNHRPDHSEDDNLKALCQRCHLRHDLRHHIATRRIKREQANKQGRLFDR